MRKWTGEVAERDGGGVADEEMEGEWQMRRWRGSGR